ncbi:MAG: pyrroline-5-carboxylate reductase [Desulfuromonas sp.]|nr:MAG: pyrroline-5-carboxylate reductase [Desulfuromonas sp.]
MFSNKMIAFIGGGNMAEAILKGLLNKGRDKSEILVSEPVAERRAYLEKTYGIATSDDNLATVEAVGTVILAIKPQMVNEVVAAFAPAFNDNKLLISILAGTPTATLQELLGGAARVVRVMPNTPALIGQGATALCTGVYADEKDIVHAEGLFTSVGITCRVREAEMDAVTAVSGSGPAYVYMVIEAMTEGGVREGLDVETARRLAVQTVAGAASLVAASGEDPAELRRKVCSPGGTTLSAVQVLEERDLNSTLIEAVRAAAHRSRELGKK